MTAIDPWLAARLFLRRDVGDTALAEDSGQAAHAANVPHATWRTRRPRGRQAFTSARARARWRATLAWLPQVRMSHHRRRPVGERSTKR